MTGYLEWRSVQGVSIYFFFLFPFQIVILAFLIVCGFTFQSTFPRTSGHSGCQVSWNWKCRSHFFSRASIILVVRILASHNKLNVSSRLMPLILSMVILHICQPCRRSCNNLNSTLTTLLFYLLLLHTTKFQKKLKFNDFMASIFVHHLKGRDARNIYLLQHSTLCMNLKGIVSLDSAAAEIEDARL